MKLTDICGHTLVGFQKRIGVRGNCFSAYTDGSPPIVKVANIGMESLQATGVAFPIDGEMREQLFYVTDERIPVEAYRVGELCFCMGGKE